MYFIRLLRGYKQFIREKCLICNSCCTVSTQTLYYYLASFSLYLSFINIFTFFFFPQMHSTNGGGFIVGFSHFPSLFLPTPKHLLLKFDFRLIIFSNIIVITWRVLDNNNPVYLKYKIYCIKWWWGTYFMYIFKFMISTVIFLTFFLGF